MILIGTPTRDSFSAGYTYDLVQLTKENPDTIFAVVQGTLLCNQRTLLVKSAIQSGATHILFIDSDMRFPPDVVRRLLAHNEPIVGANCKQRTQNQFTARKNGEFVSSENKTGLEEVDTLGFGVTLIDLEVFKKIGEPYFATPFDGDKFVGEDVYFCTIAKEHGFTIKVDHDVSQDIKHTGSIEFGI